VDAVDARGRIRKTYPTEQIMTLWERLRSIPDFEQYLKAGITAQGLSETALAMTDSQAAQMFQDTCRTCSHRSGANAPERLLVAAA
jgi:hypothetical protein